jgi:hypothetical protein
MMKAIRIPIVVAFAIFVMVLKAQPVLETRWIEENEVETIRLTDYFDGSLLKFGISLSNDK